MLLFRVNRRIVVAAVLLASSVVPFGVTRAADIRVGIILDQNGINADTGRDYVAGAKTWFDHINATGGVNGRRIQVIVKDNEGTPLNAVKLTRELIDQDKVDALFGYVGDDSLIAVAEDARFRAAKMVLFAPLSGAEIGMSSDAIVFVRPTYKDEVRHAIRHFGQLSVSRFTVVYLDNNFGRGISTEIRTQLNADGKNRSRNLQSPCLSPAWGMLHEKRWLKNRR